MSRYVTFHPWGHEPADSLVLAGVLRAVWAVHEVPLLLELQGDGSIVIGDGQPVPTAEPEEGDGGCDIAAKPIPADVTPAEKPAATAPKPARPATKTPAKTSGPKLADQVIAEAVRQHAPIATADLAKLLDVRSVGGFTRQLRRIAGLGLIEQHGATWRIPAAAPASAPTTNGTTAPAAPPKPGGVVLGPIERRPFDPEAARLRAAGEL